MKTTTTLIKLNINFYTLRFAKKSHLISHQRTHTKEKPYQVINLDKLIYCLYSKLLWMFLLIFSARCVGRLSVRWETATVTQRLTQTSASMSAKCAVASLPDDRPLKLISIVTRELNPTSATNVINPFTTRVICSTIKRRTALAVLQLRINFGIPSLFQFE